MKSSTSIIFLTNVLLLLSDSDAAQIKSPVSLPGGDRDDYFKVENFVHSYQTLPNAQLAIVPNCSHVGLMFNDSVFENYVLPFVQDVVGKNNVSYN